MNTIKVELEKFIENEVKTKSSGSSQKIKQLKALLKIVNECLSTDIDLSKINSITTLPETTTGFSDYRIIDDTDSENRELWQELKDIRLSEGDIIISFK